MTLTETDTATATVAKSHKADGSPISDFVSADEFAPADLASDPNSASDWRPLDDLDDLSDRAWDKLRGNPALDRLFYTASSLGDWSLLWHLLGALLSLKGGLHRKNFLRLSLALGAESVLVNLVVKSFFRRRRPPQPQNHPLHLRIPVTSSFPSGHACSAVLAAMLLSEASRRRWPFWMLASVVAFSRVHVRIHHVSDVAGGLALGLLLGKLVKLVAPLSRRAARS